MRWKMGQSPSSELWQAATVKARVGQGRGEEVPALVACCVECQGMTEPNPPNLCLSRGEACGGLGSVTCTSGARNELLEAVQPLGSSPQAWGTRRREIGSRIVERFIPTGVGNTRKEFYGYSVPFGSSPQAWGTRVTRWRGIGGLRFIPTGVGNTCFWGLWLSCLAVHPHRRGEHPVTRPILARGHGSSPQAWGTPGQPDVCRPGPRFIPTGVGNTLRSPPQRYAGAVHPHRRGEHSALPAYLESASGSSPQAWGTPCAPASGRGTGRFIPTGVGNTSP